MGNVSVMLYSVHFKARFRPWLWVYAKGYTLQNQTKITYRHEAASALFS
jgi:hypothetical protein